MVGSPTAVVTQARRAGDVGQVGGGPSGVMGTWVVPPWGHGHRDGTMVWGSPLWGHKDMLGVTLLGARARREDKDKVWGSWHRHRVTVAALLQGSPSRAHPRHESSVMTRAMARVMCGTGPRSQGSTLCTWCVTTRTSGTAPSWLTSAPLPLTPGLTRCCDPRQPRDPLVPHSALLCPIAPHYTSPMGAGGASTLLYLSNPLSLQVKAFGPGLEPTGCIVDRPAEFTIDARGAGKGPLKLYAQVGAIGGCRVVLGPIGWCWVLLSDF